MEFNILKYSITGYKNLIKGFRSQDYVDYKKDDKYIICSVADGHSTNFFKHSSEGAKFACKASIDILSDYFDLEMFEKMYRAAEEYAAEMVMCDNYIVSGTDGTLKVVDSVTMKEFYDLLFTAKSNNFYRMSYALLVAYNPYEIYEYAKKQKLVG